VRPLLARAFTVALGCVGVAWGAVALPVFWRHTPVEATARGIIQGDPFKPEALVALLPALDAIEAEPFCHPAALRASAIVRFRILEDTIAAGERADIDARMEALRAAIVKSLSCSPADSFLWLAYFWVTATGEGIAELKYLRMSYEQGRNEGWVAVKRNAAALAMFPQLPSDLAQAALDEFARIVQSGLIVEAADILTGTGWPIGDRLLERIAALPQPQRERLARQLEERGYDLRVPGVAPRARR